ncbi:hypothetical protein Pmani_019752 [Petrolisthes manimaculis]|uniref:Uncharacterized protein n=1 Tax=Petrolisthes manimaculis TaxID=1843537 RepID=A0AAE1PK31_9EUCA|nr:hypothetical protein Pmani_019752 [Petrolisthes manimaculis]
MSKRVRGTAGAGYTVVYFTTSATKPSTITTSNPISNFHHKYHTSDIKLPQPPQLLHQVSTTTTTPSTPIFYHNYHNSYTKLPPQPPQLLHQTSTTTTTTPTPNFHQNYHTFHHNYNTFHNNLLLQPLQRAPHISPP